MLSRISCSYVIVIRTQDIVHDSNLVISLQEIHHGNLTSCSYVIIHDSILVIYLQESHHGNLTTMIAVLMTEHRVSTTIVLWQQDGYHHGISYKLFLCCIVIRTQDGNRITRYPPR